jgi:hypothetical protein
VIILGVEKMEEETIVICFKVISRFSHEKIVKDDEKLVMSPDLNSYRLPP